LDADHNERLVSNIRDDPMNTNMNAPCAKLVLLWTRKSYKRARKADDECLIDL